LEIDTTEESGNLLTPEQADDLWRESLDRGSRISFRVASGSMHPTLAMGDRIFVEQFPSGITPRIGDIVLFFIDERWMVHRIVGKILCNGQHSYRQKGDADHRSVITPATAVAGIVVGVERGGTRIELNNTRQKIINRSIGLLFRIVDLVPQKVPTGSDDKLEADNPASSGRIIVSGVLRRTEAGLVSIVARMMWVGSRS